MDHEPLEKAVKKACRKIAKDRGAWLIGFPAFTRKGIPDDLGVYRGLFVGVEYKRRSGVVSRAQAAKHRAIRKAGGRVVVPRCGADMAAFLDGIDHEVDRILELAKWPTR